MKQGKPRVRDMEPGTQQVPPRAPDDGPAAGDGVDDNLLIWTPGDVIQIAWAHQRTHCPYYGQRFRIEETRLGLRKPEPADPDTPPRCGECLAYPMCHDDSLLRLIGAGAGMMQAALGIRSGGRKGIVVPQLGKRPS